MMRYVSTGYLLISLLLLGVSLPLSNEASNVSPDHRSPDAKATATPTDSLIIEARSLLQEGVNTADRGMMERARTQFERATADDTYAALAHYYAGLSNYRLASIFLEADDMPISNYLDAADHHLETAIDLDTQLADAYALQSSVYGLKISHRPWRAVTLGRASGTLMEQALELEPNNPRVVLLKAQSDFHTPSAFGGDKDNALEGFKKAAKLFEEKEDSDPLQPQWGHEEAYVWIGIAHAEEERYAAARTAFERALEINPDYGWVKYELLPEMTRADADS